MDKLPIYRIDFNPEDKPHKMFGLSLVSNPAIQSDFIYMSEDEPSFVVNMMDEEKREIVGAFLVPNKLIYRNINGMKFNMFFAEEDIKNILLSMSKDGFNNWFTFQHEYAVGDIYMFETWIKEFEQDKSNAYGFNEPIGTAFCKIKVDNNDVWEEVKANGVKGFSVELKASIKMNEQVEQAQSEETKFADYAQKLSELEKKIDEKFEQLLNFMTEIRTQTTYKEEVIVDGEIMETHESMVEDVTTYNYSEEESSCESCEDQEQNFEETSEYKFETYSDYPEAAKKNAQRALDWAEKNGWGSCGTDVGKARANQLASGEALTEETISRMASFERHRQNSDTPYEEGCGKLMWDAWGGDEGIAWAQKKLESIKKEKMEMSNMELENQNEEVISNEVNVEMASEEQVVEVELSEQEAEEQLLNEQNGVISAELSEQKKEEKIISRTDPMFFSKINDFLGIK